MLMRTDPFREFDRIAQQLVGAGTTSRPAVMPMDAWREGDTFVVAFDLPGVSPETLDIDVERNVLTVRAERGAPNGDWELLAARIARSFSSLSSPHSQAASMNSSAGSAATVIRSRSMAAPYGPSVPSRQVPS